MTEQEQIEQLKSWIKQYAFTVIAGIAMACLMIFTWHSWQRYHNRLALHASGVYDEMLTLKAQNNSSGVNVQAHKLLGHYPNTPYAQMAAFMLAKEAVTNKNYPEAINQLNWVAKHTDSTQIAAIAKIRIARIQVLEKKNDEALATLKQITDNSFSGLADELKGDIYMSMKNPTKAKETYQLALKELPQDEATRRPLLQMKLDNLTTVSDSIA